MDALQWEIPDNLLVIFMYCPFLGDVFSGVLARIFASFDAHPRPLRVVDNYPWEHTS